MSVECPGPDEANSVNISNQPVTSPNLTLGQTITWPANFTTTVSVTFWKGNTPPPQGASVRAVVYIAI